MAARGPLEGLFWAALQVYSRTAGRSPNWEVGPARRALADYVIALTEILVLERKRFRSDP